MNTKKAPGANRGSGPDSAGGAIFNQHLEYSIIRPHWQALIYQARTLMNAADRRGDLPNAYRHFKIWQSLSAAAYGLPYSGGDYA